MIWARIETSSADTGSSQMHQLGLQDQGARDADALALAAGEFVRIAVGLFGPQADLGHHVDDTRLDLALSVTPCRRSGSASVRRTVWRGLSEA